MNIHISLKNTKLLKNILLLISTTVLSLTIFTSLASNREQVVKAANFQMRTGYYIGNGGTVVITGLGWQPDFVMIKSTTNEGVAVFKTSAMATNTIAFTSALSDDNSGFMSLDSDGFTANGSGVGVLYHWIAFTGSDCSSSGNFCVGQYSGTGSAQTITTNFQPAFVMVKRTTAVAAHFRTASEPANESIYMDGTARNTTGAAIQSFSSTGFTVGAGVDSVSGATYNYIAFKATSGVMSEGTYAGNLTDNTNIAGVGFKPNWLIVKNATSGTQANRQARMQTDFMFGDSTSYIGGQLASISNGVQELQSDGFQIGTHATVNNTGDTYYWVAFGTTPAPSGSGDFSMTTGTYTGTGSTLAISGIGFRPDLVMIKDDAANYAVWRSSMMKGDMSAYFANVAANITGAITSLDSNGFTLGSDLNVNTSGNNYRWQAFGNAYHPETFSGANNFAVGAVYNSGSTRVVSGLPFQPDLVMTKRDGAASGNWRTPSMVGDSSAYFSSTTNAANLITSITTDGFNIGSSSAISATASITYWVAFDSGAKFTYGTYTGNSIQQDIASGWWPDLLWIKRDGSTAGVQKDISITNDEHQYFLNNANSSTRIPTFLYNGFRVDTNANEVNASANTYYYATWRSSSTSLVSISVSDGTVNYGTMNVNESKNTTAGGLNDTQTATNDGHALETFNIRGQNSSCPWTLSSSNGSDQYTHEFSTNGGSSWGYLTTSYQTLSTGKEPTQSSTFDLRLTTPTTTSCGSSQNVDVVIQAVEE